MVEIAKQAGLARSVEQDVHACDGSLGSCNGGSVGCDRYVQAGSDRHNVERFLGLHLVVQRERLGRRREPPDRVTVPTHRPERMEHDADASGRPDRQSDAAPGAQIASNGCVGDGGRGNTAGKTETRFLFRLGSIGWYATRALRHVRGSYRRAP
jgi:hypothetical protein